MRIIDEIENIDYQETKDFFKRRADKFNEDNPYSVTMYQDDNKELVKERNLHEIEKLYPMLKLEKTSTVLDVACGIGRWADAITDEIKEYCGIDFSDELIDIANSRNTKANFSFHVGATNQVAEVLKGNGKGKFNRILMIGILMYLNDDDLISALKQLVGTCEEHTIICIREPIGIQNRLTLKDFFSEELKDNYNAIYRSREEMKEFFKKSFLAANFQISEEGFLFEQDALNNRKETAQYYYILER